MIDDIDDGEGDTFLCRTCGAELSKMTIAGYAPFCGDRP